MLPHLFLCIISFFPIVYPLNNFVDNYETLNYRVVNTVRRKRSSGYGEPLNLKFFAYNRTFHLILLPLDPLNDHFHPDHILDEDGRYEDIEPHKFLYEGFVKDDPGSKVYGSILDGVFEGHIRTGDGNSYSVDRAAKYFDYDSRPSHYHSILYRDDDINHRKMRVKRSASSADPSDVGLHSCGLDDRVKRDMERIQRSAEVPPDVYTNYVTMHGRSKRATRDSNGLYTVRTCSLYLQADHKLYEHIKRKEGNNDPIRTREEIVSLFYNHIKAVNEIYEGTNFNGIKGLHFVIQRTSIYTPETCDRGRPVPGSDNPFCEENVDVSNFLNLNSQRNHSAFCLAYALTFRDFVGGTLGLAWVASPQYRIVTLVNYGNRVPTRVSQLTLAHEIGHNFGSPHDFPIECQPGLPDGNFIMFASATSGDKVNNAKFSPCSVANISSVLHVVLQSVPIDPTRHAGPVGALMKRNCFQERTSAFCGNQIHEPGEECDCGFSQADCDQMGDKCCTPHESARNGFSLSGGPCKRKTGAKCSPSEGYCCNSETCSLHQEFDYKICRHESECSETQWCNGLSAQCPPSPPKQDGLPCQDSTKVCSHGSCNGSICEFVGLKDCFLTEGRPEELCFLACIKDGKCTSSVNLPEFASNRTIFTEFVQQGRKGKSGLVLHPGSPCNNYKGYCDIFRKCRSVDANGPLARLKNLLFNKKTIETVTQWVQEKWWVVVFGALVILVLMALFIKCCAVHTPSTNPNKPPALNLYQTLTRPSTLIRQRRHRSRAALPGATSSSAAPRSSAPSAQQPSSSSRTRASAPPLPQAPPAPVIPTGSAPPVSTVLVVEPPPPYTAAADPGSALGGPRRGHRRNKRQASSDAAPKASKSRGAKTKGTKGK
nr:Peptidase M12B and Blood coagulation inhibitor domain containing protein [Haemonchus contortus]